jgi:FKBP-type peptidyl-prolyl cis-trans isomerase SlyD
MKIEPGKVVTIAFDLCDQGGEIIEASDISGPIAFVHGRGAVIPGLDGKLKGMKVGDEADFSFPPEEAFGVPEKAPTKQVNRNEFPAGIDLKVGLEFEAGIPGGQKIRLQVAAIQNDAVTVRMLHPLCGQKVSMSVKIISIRDATPIELETGRIQTRPPKPPPKV